MHVLKVVAVTAIVTAVLFAAGCGGSEAEDVSTASLVGGATGTATPRPTVSASPTPTISPSATVSPTPDGTPIGRVLTPVEDSLNVGEDRWYVLELASRSLWGAEVALRQWSPDGRYLVSSRCCSEGSLDIVEVSTGEGIRLLDEFVTASVWSPDGSRIAYSLYGQRSDGLYGATGVHIINLSDGHTEGVSERGVVAGWSPGGKQILFTTQESTTSALRIEQHLHSYHTDTEIISTITDEVGPAYGIGRLAWPPDGATMAFGGDFRKVESGPVRNPLYFYSPATGALTEAISDSVEGDLQWSPDGSKILTGYGEPVVVPETGFASRLYHVISVEDGTVSNPLPPARFPRWSPDGDRIAYISEGCVTDEWDIYVVDVDGSSRVRVTNSPDVVKEGMSWTADGGGVIYRGAEGIEIASVETGEVEVLVEGQMHYHGGGLSPDGAFQIFSSVGGHGVCD